MKLRKRSVHQRIYRGVIAALCSICVLAGVLLGWHQRAAADSTASTDPTQGTLVTIYDRGSEQTIVTKGATVGDALKDAHISLDKNDVVEPATSQKLEARSYQVNIYRARPVLVIDGAIREKIMTAHQTAAQIAKDAGITLYPEDLTALTQSHDIVADGAGLVLTITPATPVTLVLYGQPVALRTQAHTVAELLKEKSITLGSNDALSVPGTTPISSGMTINLWRNGKSTINVSEAIPFDTQTVQDANQPVGYQQVTTPGVAGAKTVTYEVDMENGQEVSRTQIQSVVTLAPVSAVETIGAQFVAGDISGQKDAYMSAAGMNQSDWTFADYIITHESGWCATKWQGEYGSCPAYHGAPGDGVGYGLCQATPGYKMASAGTDWATNPVTQLKWCSSYAQSRYGGWAAAYAHWIVHHNW